MATEAERKAAAREAKRKMRDVKRDMTPEERKAFRAKEKEMRKYQMARLDRPNIKVISPERRAERRKEAQEKRENRNLAKHFEAPSARDLAKVERERERKERRTEKRIAREQRKDFIDKLNYIDSLPDSKLDITKRLKGIEIAKGGQVKKYGYMGGGKVYAQPRKANYKAG